MASEAAGDLQQESNRLLETWLGNESDSDAGEVVTSARPERLGLGASAASAKPQLTVEERKLKNKITGSRQEDVESMEDDESSADEMESRATAFSREKKSGESYIDFYADLIGSAIVEREKTHRKTLKRRQQKKNSSKKRSKVAEI